MPYPQATPEQIDTFEARGWLAVEDAIDPAELEVLIARGEQIMERRREVAFDWAWEKGKDRSERDFKILQASPTLLWPDFNQSRFRAWAIEFASSLMRRPLDFWYDQFLAKPPRMGAITHWHQDEGYWGRNLDENGITCWMPLHDVDVTNGCMHFIDAGHRDGILEHRQPPDVQSDLLFCEPDLSRAVACSLKVGGVTFHHGKMPHMTTANSTDAWRRILSQHLRVAGSKARLY